MGAEGVPRRDFIRLGAAVGIGVAGSSVLAACGGGGGESAQGQQETTRKPAAEASTTTSPSVEAGGAIVDAAFIPAGMAFAFEVAETGKPAILVHLRDENWVAYSAACTHRGCEVAYQLEAQQLGCPCHGSVFDPADGGAVVNGPAENPLEEIEVRAEGEKVMLA